MQNCKILLREYLQNFTKIRTIFIFLNCILGILKGENQTYMYCDTVQYNFWFAFSRTHTRWGFNKPKHVVIESVESEFYRFNDKFLLDLEKDYNSLVFTMLI